MSPRASVLCVPFFTSVNWTIRIVSDFTWQWGLKMVGEGRLFYTLTKTVDDVLLFGEICAII